MRGLVIIAEKAAACHEWIPNGNASTQLPNSGRCQLSLPEILFVYQTRPASGRSVVKSKWRRRVGARLIAHTSGLQTVEQYPVGASVSAAASEAKSSHHVQILPDHSGGVCEAGLKLRLACELTFGEIHSKIRHSKSDAESGQQSRDRSRLRRLTVVRVKSAARSYQRARKTSMERRRQQFQFAFFGGQQLGRCPS